MSMSNTSVQYLANGGFNIICPISYADLTSVSSTSATLTLATIPTDAAIYDVGYVLKSNFSGGATSALTVKIGDDDDDDGFVTATSVHGSNSPISSKLNNGAYFTGTDSGSATTANVIKSKNYDNSGTKGLKIVFTATGANLSALTAGKLVVFVKGADLTAIA